MVLVPVNKHCNVDYRVKFNFSEKEHKYLESKGMLYCKCCIYTHPVNKKITIRQVPRDLESHNSFSASTETLGLILKDSIS